MSVPKYDELMKPLLMVVKDGNVHKIKEAAAALAQRLHLSEEELTELLPSGRQTVFRNRVGWAATYLVKAGLLQRPSRASLVITDAGKQVLSENPDKIDAKYLERFSSFAKFISTSTQTKADNSSTKTAPKSKELTLDEQLEETYGQINANLASDVLEEVLKISPYTFERFVVDLLIKMGYGAVEYGSHATAASGDDGIDGIIREDKLGFSLIYMQAKQWDPSRVVGQPEIQSFIGAKAEKHGDGLFVTTARFSQKAKACAERNHIILIDGEKLANLMIEYNFCVSTRRTFEIKELDTDMFAEYQEE